MYTYIEWMESMGVLDVKHTNKWFNFQKLDNTEFRNHDLLEILLELHLNGYLTHSLIQKRSYPWGSICAP